MTPDARDNGAVLLTGATGGLGTALARQLAREGRPLVLAARDETELNLLANDIRTRFEIDVQTVLFDAAEPFVADTLLGRDLAGVVLNHGMHASREQAASDPSAHRRMLEVNYWSYVVLAERAAELLAERGGGFIGVIASVAGDRGRARNYPYGATKAALSAYAGGLGARVWRSNVYVLTVKPGTVDTAMTWGHDRGGPVADPDDVARDICRAIRRKRSVLYTPWIWRPIMAAVRALPNPIFKRLNV